MTKGNGVTMIKKYFKVIVSIFLMEICAETVVAQMNVPDESYKDEIMMTRINNRVNAISKQFGKLRMVIGGPGYLWGIDPQIESDLKDAGMNVLIWPNVPLLSEDSSPSINNYDRLTGYNIIIFGDSFYHLMQPDLNTGEMPEKIKGQIPLLRKFLEEGGSIWFCGLAEYDFGRSSHVLNYILKELGLDAEVAGEVVNDNNIAISSSFRDYKYAWVEVIPDSLTKGVPNLLHPCGIIDLDGSIGVSPIVKLGPEWRVLLRGKESAASYACTAGVTGGLQKDPGIVKSSPILCAVRESGKGRVVLWPTWSNFTVTGGSGGMVIDGEKDGVYSDGALLIENLLCWLAEPSQGSNTVGTFPEKYIPVQQPDSDINRLDQFSSVPGRKIYPTQFKGLIGAHSNLSDGVSSAKEMIISAKYSGYDFIAFTEDFAKMDEKKWNELVAICDKANAEDDKFIAYPGLDFLDETGNRGVYFGNRFWIKDELRSKEYPDRIKWWYNLSYQIDANPWKWLPRVIIRSKTNNKRPWNQGLWNFFGAYCYEDGKLIDDSFDEWQRLIRRHVYFMNIGIMAVHTVHSVKEIEISSKPGFYQTYVRADNLQQVLSRLSGHVGSQDHFPSYVSKGPEILDFNIFAIRPGWEGIDCAILGNDRGLLHILVLAEAGLKEVSVYDGERLVRRFMPEGNKFETYMTFHPESYHAYSLVVTDKDGYRAVSWPAWMQIQEFVHRRSGDNFNWMVTGKKSGSLIPPKFNFLLMELHNGWTPKKFVHPKERKKDVELPRYKCEQGDYSHGGLSAAINGYISLGDPRLLIDRKPWSIRSYPAMTLDFTTIGPFGVILTNTVTEEMLIPPDGDLATTIGCFSGPYKVVPSPCPGELKQYVPLQKPDGASINRYSGKVTFTKEISTSDKGPLYLILGATSTPGANILEVMNPDGSSKKYTVGNKELSGEIPVGGYVCWYDENGKGIGGIISFSPGVFYTYSKRHQRCLKRMFSPVKSGTEVNWDVIFVTGDATTINSNTQMEDIRVGMGISGEPKLYKVDARVGKVLDQKFFLTLEAQDNGFSGKIVKTGKKSLPIHLPVFVNGINPRWDAGIWYRGETELHKSNYYRDQFGLETWRWVIATYEPVRDEIRYIPVMDEGRAYCQVDTDKQDSDVFIGNFLVCDQPEVFISIINVDRNKCIFEVNNPTDKELECIVRPSKGFDLTGKWQKKVVLSAGAWQKFEVEVE